MTDEEKRGIETQLALKEKALAIKEREHELEVKQWQKKWGNIGGIFVLFLCFCVICIGGCGIGGCGEKSLVQWRTTNQKEQVKSSVGLTNLITVSKGKCADGTNVVQTISLPENSLGIVTPNNSTTLAFRNAETKNDNPFPYLPFTTLLINSLLVIAGLCVAAYTVRVIVKEHND